MEFCELINNYAIMHSPYLPLELTAHASLRGISFLLIVYLFTNRSHPSFHDKSAVTKVAAAERKT